VRAGVIPWHGMHSVEVEATVVSGKRTLRQLYSSNHMFDDILQGGLVNEPGGRYSSVEVMRDMLFKKLQEVFWKY